MKYTMLPDCQINGLADVYLKYFGYKEDGIFIEGGAFDGYSISNTWGLAEAGWGGLYIEPILDNFNRCKKNHEVHPKVKTVHSALGDYNGFIDMHLAGGNSSYSKTIINSNLFKGVYSDSKIERVPISTLDSLLTDNKIPAGFDLLVIDTECSEIQVLGGFTLEMWKPKMVIIETHEGYQYPELSTSADFINKFFSSYDKVLSDTVNNIYVRRIGDAV